MEWANDPIIAGVRCSTWLRIFYLTYTPTQTGFDFRGWFCDGGAGDQENIALEVFDVIKDEMMHVIRRRKGR